MPSTSTQHDQTCSLLCLDLRSFHVLTTGFTNVNDRSSQFYSSRHGNDLHTSCYLAAKSTSLLRAELVLEVLEELLGTDISVAARRPYINHKMALPIKHEAH